MLFSQSTISCKIIFLYISVFARCGGAEVAGWTLDTEDPGSIPHLNLTACGPSDGKEVHRDVFGHPGAL